MACCLSPSGEALPLSANFIKCYMRDHTEYEFVILAPCQVQWTLCRRYREFHQLHEQLLKRYPAELSGVHFPPKRALHNTSTAFVMQRQQDLQNFMREILKIFRGIHLPPPLAEFIEWEKYEIHGITSALARKCFQHGPQILQQGFPFQFSVFEVHAINARLKSAAPTNIYNTPASDFGNVMDFVHCLQSLKVHCPYQKFYRRSNVVLEELPVDLSCFKSLLRLELLSVNVKRVDGFLHLKKSVMTLVVHDCLRNVKSLMLGDLYAIGHGDWVFGRDKVATTAWEKATLVDLSRNDLVDLDPSIALLVSVEELNLANNRLVNAAHLASMSRLSHLHLSHNRLYVLENSLEQRREKRLTKVGQSGGNLELGNGTRCSVVKVDREETAQVNLVGEEDELLNDLEVTPLHTRLGNITHLWMDHNRLRSALLVDRLFSLRLLDLSHNEIASFVDVMSINQLHCLERLMLHHNPISEDSDYRLHIFDIMGDRMDEVQLDGIKASVHELQKVRMRRAHKLMASRGSMSARPAGNSVDIGPSFSLPSSTPEFHYCVVRLLPSQLPFVVAGTRGDLTGQPAAASQRLRLQDHVRLRNFLQHSMFSMLGRHHSILHYIPVLWQHARNIVRLTSQRNTSTERDAVTRRRSVGANYIFVEETEPHEGESQDEEARQSEHVWKFMSEEDGQQEEEDVTPALLVCSAQKAVIMLCVMRRVASHGLPGSGGAPDTASRWSASDNASSASLSVSSEVSDGDAGSGVANVTAGSGESSASRETFRVEPHHIIHATALQQLVVCPHLPSSSSSLQTSGGGGGGGGGYLRMDLVEKEKQGEQDTRVLTQDVCHVADGVTMDWLVTYLLKFGQQQHSSLETPNEEGENVTHPGLTRVDCDAKLKNMKRFLSNLKRDNLHSTKRRSIPGNGPVIPHHLRLVFSRPALFQFEVGLVSIFTVVLTVTSYPAESETTTSPRSRLSTVVDLWVVKERHLAHPPPLWTTGQLSTMGSPGKDTNFPTLKKGDAPSIRSSFSATQHRRNFSSSLPVAAHGKSPGLSTGSGSASSLSRQFACLGRYPASEIRLVRTTSPRVASSTQFRPSPPEEKGLPTLPSASSSPGSFFPAFRHELVLEHCPASQLTPEASGTTLRFAFQSKYECTEFTNHLHSEHMETLPQHLATTLTPRPRSSSVSAEPEVPPVDMSLPEEWNTSTNSTFRGRMSFASSASDSGLLPLLTSSMDNIAGCPSRGELTTQYMESLQAFQSDSLRLDTPLLQQIRASPLEVILGHVVGGGSSSSSSSDGLVGVRLCVWCHAVSSLEDPSDPVEIQSEDTLPQRLCLLAVLNNGRVFLVSDKDLKAPPKSPGASSEENGFLEVANSATEVDRDMLLLGGGSGSVAERISLPGVKVDPWELVDLVEFPLNPFGARGTVLRHAYLSMFHLWIRLVFTLQTEETSSSSPRIRFHYVTLFPHSSETTRLLWHHVKQFASAPVPDEDEEQSEQQSLATVAHVQDDSTFELNELLHHLRLNLRLHHPPQLAFFCLLHSFSLTPSEEDPIRGSTSRALHLQSRSPKEADAVCPMSQSSFILLEKHICVVQLDTVHYPLLFDIESLSSYFPPRHPGVSLVLAQPLALLHEVTTSSFDPHQMILTFQVPSASSTAIPSGRGNTAGSEETTSSSLLFDPGYYEFQREKTSSRTRRRDQLSDTLCPKEYVHLNLELAHVSNKQSLLRMLRKRFSERFGRDLQFILN